MIEISVQEDFWPMATRIYVTNKLGDVRMFLQPDGEWIPVEASETATRPDVKPSLTLPMGLGQELLEALMRHFHGADDARMLRKDYDAERERVNKLTEAMIGIATNGRHVEWEARS